MLVYLNNFLFLHYTLQNLLNHAVSFNEQLETFEYIYNLTEEEDDDNKYEETDDETS